MISQGGGGLDPLSLPRLDPRMVIGVVDFTDHKEYLTVVYEYIKQ